MAKSGNPKPLKLGTRLAFEGYLFMAPWIIGFLVFMAYPIVFSLYISFFKVNITGTGFNMSFIGLENYKHAFLKDEIFPTELFLFAKQTVLIVFIIVMFALVISIMINQKFPGRALFRVIFFLPVILSSNSIISRLDSNHAGELSFIKDYDVAGFLTQYLSKSLATPILNVLDNFVLILWYSGVQVLIFLGGMQTICGSVYEAARIDGASPWETFWKITLPGISPFIVLNLIYTLVDQFTSPFSKVLTHIVSVKVDSKTGFGYSSALGWIFFAMILVALGLIILLGKKAATSRDR